MAEVTRVIFEDLIDRFPEHYEIEQIGLFHIYAITTPRWPIYPTMVEGDSRNPRLDKDDICGLLTLRERIALTKPDLVFAFNDPQHLIPIAADTSRSYRLVLYTNIDGVPHFFKNTDLIHADRVVTMSLFALTTETLVWNTAI